MTRNTIFTFFLCITLVYPAVTFAQGEGNPKVTSIQGGFFVEWDKPFTISAIHLDKTLFGAFEVMFDIPTESLAALLERKSPPPPTPDMVRALADYWIVREKPEKAIALYESCLERGNVDSDNVLLFHNNLAMLYSMDGQYNKAMGIVNTALEKNKDDSRLLDTKGLIFLHSGSPAQAIPPLRRAVELSCQLPMYCMHLAYALLKNGEQSNARRYLETAWDQLIPLVPKMTKENKAMFDELQSQLPALGTQ